MKVIFKIFELLIIVFRMKWWGVFGKKLNKTHNLQVFPGYNFDFLPYGDIVKIVYGREFLLKSKKSFEYNTFQQFQQHIKPNQTVFDIGANVGVYSLFASKLVGTEGKVFSIEPSEKTFSTLEGNVNLNKIKNISMEKIAFSNSKEEVVLSLPEMAKDRYEDSFKSIDYNINPKEGNLSENQEIIHTIPFDDFIIEKNIKNIDFIKVDIEGAELLFFKGATNLLSSENRPIIVFECSERHCERFDYTVADTLSYLKGFNYHIKQYEDRQYLATPIT